MRSLGQDLRGRDAGEGKDDLPRIFSSVRFFAGGSERQGGGTDRDSKLPERGIGKGRRGDKIGDEVYLECWGKV